VVATTPARSETPFAALIDAFGRRVCPAVLEQHERNSVASPLGIWLLLAACSSAASGGDRDALEEVLGCTAREAVDLLGRFLDHPPSAIHTAVALWVRDWDITPALMDWNATLPSRVEAGAMPSQAEADLWADRHTLGLINRFPLRIERLTRLVLASAIATKVSWKTPFEVVDGDEHLRASSPWRGSLSRVLLARETGMPMMLATTEAAGVVAVHLALAEEDLGVVSVAAAPEVERRLVVEAAYEIAARYREDDLASARCSLFDLPLGSGHSWELTEREVPTDVAGKRSEGVESAVLTAWHARCRLDLKASELFAAEPALRALIELIGPHPEEDETDAVHSAVASYTPTGFEAGALTALGIILGEAPPPTATGLERRARLCFDHPHAALALAGSRSDFYRSRAGHSEMFGLPLFAAWVDTPEEAEAPMPAEAAPGTELVGGVLRPTIPIPTDLPRGEVRGPGKGGNGGAGTTASRADRG
jgi:Serpin (serine protease inhibitor)